MISESPLSPLAVANDLRPVLFRLTRELRRETEQLGVTSRQATLMGLVQRRPGVALRTLAAEEGISPPALSGHVDRLEGAGLLVRVRSESDRRRVGLALTVRGERLLRGVRRRRTMWLADRLGALEPHELAAIAQAIDPLTHLASPPREQRLDATSLDETDSASGP